MTHIRWMVIGLLAAVLLTPMAVGVRILTFPKTLMAGQFDCAIVLGAAVSNDRPTPVFQARLNHGIALHQQDVVEYLLFTGGIGAGDTQAESEVGATYAETQGVPAGDILIETTSKTTPQNLAEAQALMSASGLETAVIVSDPLHLHRSQLIANALGMEAVTSATPTTRYRSWQTKLPFLLREIYFTLLFKLVPVQPTK